jgi:hypothetical protein
MSREYAAPVPRASEALPARGTTARAGVSGHASATADGVNATTAGQGNLQHRLASVSLDSEAAQPVVQLDPNDEPPPRPAPGLWDAMRTGMGPSYATFVGHNVWRQQFAHLADPSTRMGAIQHTASFQPGQIGHGAHWGIRNIHALLGGIGQSNIGALFGDPHMQVLMRQQIASPANREVGTRENRLWRQRLAGVGAAGPSTIGERFGGVLGSMFNAGARSSLQTFGDAFRTAAPRAALRSAPAAAVALGVWDGVSQWRRRLQQ